METQSNIMAQKACEAGRFLSIGNEVPATFKVRYYPIEFVHAIYARMDHAIRGKYAEVGQCESSDKITIERAREMLKDCVNDLVVLDVLMPFGYSEKDILLDHLSD